MIDINSMIALAEGPINAQALDAAEPWVTDLMQTADAIAEAWRHELELDLPQDVWEDVYKPALLWRFFHNVALKLDKASDGHRDVFFLALQRRYEGGED